MARLLKGNYTNFPLPTFAHLSKGLRVLIKKTAGMVLSLLGGMCTTSGPSKGMGYTLIPKTKNKYKCGTVQAKRISLQKLYSICGLSSTNLNILGNFLTVEATWSHLKTTILIWVEPSCKQLFHRLSVHPPEVKKQIYEMILQFIVTSLSEGQQLGFPLMVD